MKITIKSIVMISSNSLLKTAVICSCFHSTYLKIRIKEVELIIYQCLPLNEYYKLCILSTLINRNRIALVKISTIISDKYRVKEKTEIKPISITYINIRPTIQKAFTYFYIDLA